jgi:hypothetical protein
MDVTDLQYVAVTADSGNFARAARVLGLNTSTISRRVARLEGELGLSIFERCRKGLRVTSGGLLVAFVGTYLSVNLNLPVLDGAASILIGFVLAVTATLLARETKGLLIGERANQDIVVRSPD